MHLDAQDGIVALVLLTTVASLLALSPALRSPIPSSSSWAGWPSGSCQECRTWSSTGYRAGEGALVVRLFGMPLKMLRGDAVTKGEAMRCLAELPWAPAAMAHNHELQWREMDERTVEVATSVAGPRLAVLLRFDDAGDVVVASCDDRPRAVGRSSIETPWAGEFSEYRVLGGVRVPARVEVRWDLPEGPFVYFRGQLTELAFG